MVIDIVSVLLIFLTFMCVFASIGTVLWGELHCLIFECLIFFFSQKGWALVVTVPTKDFIVSSQTLRMD